MKGKSNRALIHRTPSAKQHLRLYTSVDGPEAHGKTTAKKHHPHNIKWAGPNKQSYNTTCNGEGSIKDVLMRSEGFKELVHKNKMKELLILKEGKAISAHFPCRMLDEKELLIKFVNVKKVENIPEESEADIPLPGNQSGKAIVFHLWTSGGENIKFILKNQEIKSVCREITVYAYEGETVEDALQRDGRFLDSVFEKQSWLIQMDTEEIQEISSVVCDTMNNKQFKIGLKRPNKRNPKNGKPGGNGGAATANEGDQGPAQPSPATEPGYDGTPDEQPNQNKSMALMESMHEIPKSEEFVCVLKEVFDKAMKAMEISFRGPNLFPRIQKCLRVEYGKNDEACREVRVMKELVKLSDSVCIVVIDGRPVGTGFLLFDRFVLTNCHVAFDVRNGQPRENITVHFKFEKALHGGDSNPANVVAARYFSANDQLEYSYDWALLELDKTADVSCSCLLEHFGYLPSSGGLCIIGHPDGGVKKIHPCFIIPATDYSKTVEKHHVENPEGVTADPMILGSVQLVGPQFFNYVNNQMTKSNPTVKYNTCFYFGSSGSPVFDNDCKVVALHSGGYFYRNKKNEAQSVIEYGYLLSSIIEDMIIELVEEKRFDVLSKYLSVDYNKKSMIRDGVKKLTESRGFTGFNDALHIDEVTNNKDLNDFISFICERGTVGIECD